MKSIKIANGQGFWGDSIDAPLKLLKYGNFDYLTLDYLAEVTMSIMQKQKMKNASLGYASDFIQLIKKSINLIIKNNIKIITNAGGVNPVACANELKKLCKEHKKDIKIAIITGDDILKDIDSYILSNNKFINLDTNMPISDIKDRICSANVYINSFTIKEALSAGADIVLCGRVSDPGLSLGPMLYEFDWQESDFNKLASGTLAGHIIECGAQCTGGNHTNWKNVNNLASIGYPIAEVYNDGTFNISKPNNSGGLINKFTILEQVLYEMGNPKEYISPDVIVDFTSFDIYEKGNKIFIKNVKGRKPTNTYKVAISYSKGFKATGQLTISGPNSLEKAKLTSQIIWGRLENAGYMYENKNTEYLGLSPLGRDTLNNDGEMNEIVLRLSVQDKDFSKVKRFGKEIAPVITSGPPGITGFSGGRPKPQEIIAFWPALIDKKLIQTKVYII